MANMFSAGLFGLILGAAYNAHRKERRDNEDLRARQARLREFSRDPAPFGGRPVGEVEAVLGQPQIREQTVPGLVQHTWAGEPFRVRVHTKDDIVIRIDTIETWYDHGGHDSECTVWEQKDEAR